MSDPVTSEKYNEFLSMLAEVGNATKCCDALGMSRFPVYNRRLKSKKFREKWELAKKMAVAKLEDEAWRRAFEGVTRPVFYKGEQLKNADGTLYFERTYSDTLLMHRLNAERPDKYQYRQRIDGNIDANITVKVVKFAAERKE